tara:strand:- start:3047 stop:4708 length:1662 start_codon:yes stop_codon:yes gene_type:complete
MGRFDIRTRSGLLSTIIQGQTASPSDGDAQAFIFRVEAAGGTLTTTEKNSINTLVIRLKALSLWTKMKALYPMVGASAVACAQNLKSSDYTATFFGGLTYASTGVTGNGSTGYINTGLTPSTALTNANHHISFYSRTNPTPTNGIDMGVGEASNGYSSPFFRIRVDGFYGLTNTFKYDCGDVAAYGSVTSTVTDSRGHFIGNILNTSNRKTYKDGVVSGTNTTLINNQLGTGPIYIFATNNMPSTPGLYTNKECAFTSIGDGLSDTEAANFYNAVQEFQTLLGRQIGAPAVSDVDASAFIARVYAAGGTLTSTEANAVNQLTIDLKAANLWTSMKAIYPMVGSSAAACAQNLKSSSYTGTFSGGITYAATGATGNGSTGYMNTGLTANTQLTPANHHISFYSRTNPTSTNGVDMGVGEIAAGYQSPFFRIRVDGFYGLTNTFKYDSGNDSSYASTNSTNTDSRGFFIGSILSTSNRKTYKNGSISGTLTTTITNTLAPGNIYIFAINSAPNSPQFYTNKECAFASIGDGLTDTNASDFYTAVQAFQTTLSRNV